MSMCDHYGVCPTYYADTGMEGDRLLSVRSLLVEIQLDSGPTLEFLEEYRCSPEKLC